MASLRLIACVIVLAGCYDVPQPACGFQCGPPASIGGDGTCPDGYACVEDRCRLLSDPPTSCPAIVEPPITDSTAPGVMARSPMPGETDVALDALILVTFDEKVTGVTPASFGVQFGASFVAGEITIASPDRAWRFTPDRPLVVNRTYEVVLGSAITDFAGNPLPETRWMFSTIEDLTGPTIAFSTPMAGAMDVSVTSALSVSFDEPIAGADASSIRLEQNGTSQPITVSMPLANTVSIDHDPLAGETLYTIVFTSDITDLVGNPMTPTTLSFTTVDTTPPAITNRTPPPDATGVAITTAVSLTFSEVLGDQDITLSVSGTLVAVVVTDVVHPDGTYTIALTPTAPLAPDTVYTVNIGIVRDVANNPATIPSYTFTTAP